MVNRLNKRVILVTGGASGIGEALCKGFAEEGAAVTIADLDIDKAQAVAEGIVGRGGRAIAVQMDVANREDVKAGISATVAEFGRLDSYFNNAGMNSPMKMLDVTEDNFNLIMRVNVLGGFGGYAGKRLSSSFRRVEAERLSIPPRLQVGQVSQVLRHTAPPSRQ